MASPQITPQAGPWSDYQPQQAGPWQDYKRQPVDETKRLGADQPDTNAMPEASTKEALPRSVLSLGKTIAGIPGGLYHAFSDAPSPEESTELQSKELDPNSSFDRAGLRLVAHPLNAAADWWKGAATGKVPNAYEQALSVGPEAMGQGGAAVLAPKLLSKIGPAASGAADIAQGPVGKAVGAAAREVPVAAIRRIPYVGKVAADVYKAGAKAYSADAPPVQASAGLGNIPMRPAVAPARPTPAPAPVGQPARPVEYPPPAPRPVIQRGPIAGSPEDLAETKNIQEQIRDAAEGEDRTRLSQEKREWFARNQPGSTKAELTGTANKPIRYTKTPGVKVDGKDVAPDADLTRGLEESVRKAKLKKGKG